MSAVSLVISVRENVILPVEIYRLLFFFVSIDEHKSNIDKVQSILWGAERCMLYDVEAASNSHKSHAKM